MDDVCYLAIFENQQLKEAESGTWILGTVVMQHYYFIFDSNEQPNKLFMGQRAGTLEIVDNFDDDSFFDHKHHFSVTLTVFVAFVCILYSGIYLKKGRDGNLKVKDYRERVADIDLHR